VIAAAVVVENGFFHTAAVPVFYFCAADSSGWRSRIVG
jgi:hypothetical protein